MDILNMNSHIFKKYWEKFNYSFFKYCVSSILFSL